MWDTLFTTVYVRFIYFFFLKKSCTVIIFANGCNLTTLVKSLWTQELGEKHIGAEYEKG